MLHWVIPGQLAKASRPGYLPGPEFTVGADVVDAWIAEARAFGVASVICLIDHSQLWLYRHALPDGGLLGRYRAAGLEVAHVPTADELAVPFTPEQYEDAYRAYQDLPRAVLVHCSAGHDRTGRVVDYILGRLDAEGGQAAG